MTQLLTVREAAKVLRLSVPTLYRLMRAGQLKSVKLGGARRIPEREVERLVTRKTR